MNAKAETTDRLWSTGEIARLTGCDIKSVRRWIDQGMLEGFRMPDMGKEAPERRVYHDVLRAFLVKHGFDRPVARMDVLEPGAAGVVPPKSAKPKPVKVHHDNDIF